MKNGFALNHDKNLQIYFFCVKRQAKNDFLKDVESTVSIGTDRPKKTVQTQIRLVLKNTLTLLYHPSSRQAMLSADSSCSILYIYILIHFKVHL